MSRVKESFVSNYVSERLRQLRAGVQPEFYILLPEAIGDLIACEPILRYLKRVSPNSKIKWLVRSNLAEVLSTNRLISEVIQIDSLKEGVDICTRAELTGVAIVLWCRLHRTHCKKTGFVFNNPVNPRIDFSNYYSLGNLLETFCYASGIPPLSEQPMYDLTGTKNLLDRVPRSYVVIHCNSSETVRNWTAEGWRSVASYLISRGYVVVEVGLLPVIGLTDENYFDLTGARHIPDVIRTISEATLFLGCDSCFAHAANAVSVKAIVLLGKYEVWDSYYPYSGTFARDNFQIVRAGFSEQVSEIRAEDVIDAVSKVL